MDYFLSSLPGLISAYLYNDEYVKIQSEIFSNNLAGRQWSNEVLDSIKNTPYKEGAHGKEYEVGFNPGRSFFLDYSYLMAAWKMWFSEPFFTLVPKEKILSFPIACDIKNCLLEIQLHFLYKRGKKEYSKLVLLKKELLIIDFLDLINTMNNKYLVVDGMLNGTGIRDYYEGGCINPQELNLSSGLQELLNAWLSQYWEAFYSNYSDKFLTESLDAEGMRIAQLVQVELGGKVWYYLMRRKRRKHFKPVATRSSSF